MFYIIYTQCVGTMQLIILYLTFKVIINFNGDIIHIKNGSLNCT